MQYRKNPPDRIPHITEKLGLSPEEEARLRSVMNVSKPFTSPEITKKGAVYYARKIPSRTPRPSASEGWKNGHMLEREYVGDSVKHTAAIETLAEVLADAFKASGMSETEARDEISADWIISPFASELPCRPASHSHTGKRRRYPEEAHSWARQGADKEITSRSCHAPHGTQGTLAHLTLR